MIQRLILHYGWRASALLCWLVIHSVTDQQLGAQEANPQTAEVSLSKLRSAAERALPLVEQSSAEYLRQRECFSCHHQSMSILTLMEARSRGLKIDYDNLQKQVERSLEHLKRGQADYQLGKGQGGGIDTAGHALLGLSAAGMSPNATTDAVSEYLLQIHANKKHWGCTGNRPPTQSSDITTTAIALRGLLAYGPTAQAFSSSHEAGKSTTGNDALKRLAKRLIDCDQWMDEQSPADTEQRVVRIMAQRARNQLARHAELGIVSDKAAKAIVQMEQELLSSQRSDGGWAQLPNAADAISDAYATGTTLVALAEGGFDMQQPAYQRGLAYLLSTQQADGSWHVVTRSQPIQKYFESGFPHGVDQFISMSATCWSTIAILKPLPESLDAAAPTAAELPWIQSKPAPTQVAGVDTMTPEQTDFFEREIRPVLVENCASCHSEEKQSGGLRVDSLAALLSGGDSGPAIVARDADRSLLIKAVLRDSNLQMPPDDPLSARRVAKLKQWIDMGAPWPKSATPADFDKRRSAAALHWAFQPPSLHPLPEVRKTDWAGQAIDRFVLAELESRGLEPNAAAPRRELLRRISYDLLGLPPTVEELSAIQVDDRPDAVDRAIDRLMASPKLGEHWARHWLDVARYSDTKGYVYGREERFFVHAPAYRDWVVKAFSDDMPYDQFVKLQVAADQIAPEDPAAQVAMGFLTVGRRFLGVTHDIIDDRIDVVSRGLLGLTVGCARCHDHKFDPIPTADYYSLYGVFQNSIERRVRVPDGRPAEQLKAFDEELAKRQQKYDEQLAAEKKIVNERILSRLTDYLQSQLELQKYPAEGFDVLIQKDDLVPAQVRRFQAFFIDAAIRQEPIFAAWRVYLAIPAEEFPQAATTATQAVQAMSAEQLNPLVRKLFLTPPDSMRQVAERYGSLLGKLAEVSTADAVDQQALAHLKQFVGAPNSPCRMPDEDIVSTEQFYETRVCEALWRLQGEIDRWIIQSPSAPTFATVLTDRPSIREPHVFRRGNPLQIDQRVPRQFLSVLTSPESTPAVHQPTTSMPTKNQSTSVSRLINTTKPVAGGRLPRHPFEHGSGRRELAEAIVDSRNPLTARVWVNRIWQHLLGQGIVPTTSDFGLRAPEPSHLELLDNLALELVESDYSTKYLIRKVISSQTYQQSSQAESATQATVFAKANDLDPDNRLLWRAPSKRLSFEERRDTWLAVVGELDYSVGGRARALFGEGINRRRTLYGLIDRQFLTGVLRVFDFANPDLHIAQRSETTVPQQALFEMNHEFTAHISRSLASECARSVNDSSKTDEQVAWIFQRVFGRAPTEQEVADGRNFLNQPADVLPKVRTQSRDWKYGFGKWNETSGAIEGFTALPHFTGTAWQGGAQWPDANLGWVQLTATGGHAGNDLEHAAVRRWIAPRAGAVKIRSNVIHNVSAGDGIRAVLIHHSANGSKVLHNAVAHNNQFGVDQSDLQVAAGDSLDFVVNFNTNLNNDQFLWSPAIDFTSPNSSSTNATPSADDQWNAELDFVGAQPTYLTPLEQLAQVLLLSNELAFVD